jgi:hypothetical protein
MTNGKIPVSPDAIFFVCNGFVSTFPKEYGNLIEAKI